LEEETKEAAQTTNKRNRFTQDTENDSLQSLIDRSERLSLEKKDTPKGEISSIENIYKKVFGNNSFR
jgi:hypothetical protein